MSKHEKNAWASLVASLLVWSYFTMRMTENWAVVEVSVRHMAWTYASVIVLMIVAHAVIAAALASRDEAADTKDERDRAIELKAERIEGYVVLAAINVIVIHALAHAAFEGHAFPPIDLASLPTLVFVLISVLFAGHAANQVTIVWSYRR